MIACFRGFNYTILALFAGMNCQPTTLIMRIGIARGTVVVMVRGLAVAVAVAAAAAVTLLGVDLFPGPLGYLCDTRLVRVGLRRKVATEDGKVGKKIWIEPKEMYHFVLENWKLSPRIALFMEVLVSPNPPFTLFIYRDTRHCYLSD